MPNNGHLRHFLIYISSQTKEQNFNSLQSIRFAIFVNHTFVWLQESFFSCQHPFAASWLYLELFSKLPDGVKGGRQRRNLMSSFFGCESTTDSCQSTPFLKFPRFFNNLTYIKHFDVFVINCCYTTKLALPKTRFT